MILILNGPPGCGKDTIAEVLRRRHGFAHTRFKHDIYEEAAKVFGISARMIRARNEDRYMKESPFVDGLSVREMLIYTSEHVCKPRHGADYFGRLAAERCAGMDGLGLPIVFSDGGFIEEVNCLPGAFVVRLHREGFTFDGDSRSYLYPEHVGRGDPNTASAAAPPVIQSYPVRSADVRLLDGQIDKAVRDVLVACRWPA